MDKSTRTKNMERWIKHRRYGAHAVATLEDVQSLATALDGAETEIARLTRLLDTATPWLPIDAMSRPLTDEELRALKLRWHTANESYQADADAMIASIILLRQRVEELEKGT